MKYKIMISDFDDTLVRKDGTVSETNKKAIADYTASGGVFAVCSGRLTQSILPRVRELGLEGVLASFHGAVISEIATGNVLRCEGFEDKLAYEVIKITQSFDYHTHIYTPDTMYCNVDDELLHFYEKVCRVEAKVEPDLYALATHGRLHIMKLAIAMREEDRKQVEKTLRAALPQSCDVTSTARYLVEITPRGKGKGAAVEFLSQYYGVPTSQIAAIGDMISDIPMLEAAGGRFAVDNAEEELKRIATVVPACEDDGVACALRMIMEDRA